SRAQIDRAVMISQTSGQLAIRDELLECSNSLLPAAPVSTRAQRALMIVDDGLQQEAEQLILYDAKSNPDLQADEWRAQIAHAASRNSSAAGILTTRNNRSGPVTQENVKLLLRSLIDSEEAGAAWK